MDFATAARCQRLTRTSHTFGRLITPVSGPSGRHVHNSNSVWPDQAARPIG